MVMEMHKRHKAILPSLNLKNKEWALKPQTLERPHLNKTETEAYAVEPMSPFFQLRRFRALRAPHLFIQPSAVTKYFPSLTEFIRAACKRPSCDKRHQALYNVLFKPFSQPGHFRLPLKFHKTAYSTRQRFSFIR